MADAAVTAATAAAAALVTKAALRPLATSATSVAGTGGAGGAGGPRLFRELARAMVSRSALAFVAGGVCISVLRMLYEVWQRVRRARAEHEWRRHTDFSEIQACLLSTEHLESLGRVEKRTLFVKPIAEVFKNEYILSRVLEAAQKSLESKDPMMCVHLSPEDKWHVLNTCTNHISEVFAPYHVFFNEARRSKSYYKSAWYCFTLTCHQNDCGGRWFITPFRPVGAGDCGSLRIRLVMANEQELRDISAGTLLPPESGLFNGRHDNRWRIFRRFADLFGRQLGRLETADKARSSSSHGTSGEPVSGLSKKKKVASNVRLAGMVDCGGLTEIGPEDNAILRIHIPFPSSYGREKEPTEEGGQERVSKDVVLYA